MTNTKYRQNWKFLLLPHLAYKVSEGVRPLRENPIQIRKEDIFWLKLNYNIPGAADKKFPFHLVLAEDLKQISIKMKRENLSSELPAWEEMELGVVLSSIGLLLTEEYTMP